VTSFTSLDDVGEKPILDSSGNSVKLKEVVLGVRKEMTEQYGQVYSGTNDSELAAFIDYAQAYPNGFLALIDTYDVLFSGVRNFIVVAIALRRLGFMPRGVRLDSGDLAYLSKECRRVFQEVEKAIGYEFGSTTIVASNDINESVIQSLNRQGHEIDVYGIGTHLITCQAQPALGCVFKLVQVGDKPRIKLSADAGKITIPGTKKAYRLFGKDGIPLLDLLLQAREPPPQVGKRVLCRHPFHETKRVYVVPTEVKPLHHCVWDGDQDLDSAVNIDHVSMEGAIVIDRARTYLKEQLEIMREDHLRGLNPTPYKVSVSEGLYEFLHSLMETEAPIQELC